MLMVGLIVGFCSPVNAQTDPLFEGSNVRPLTASGSIGFSANAYTASGIQNRRAPASLQTTANLNFSIFGFSSGLNLLYSTDQSKFRQNMNNISFDASWKWLTVQAGNVSPNFSDYGLNGATLKGGYIKLEPGMWLLELSGGRSKKGISQTSKQGFRSPAFERWTMAGKIGFESEGENHFYLSSQYSLDRSKSLDDPGDITPKENLTLTPDARISLFDGTFSLKSQVTVSAYTRDLNSAEVPISDLGLPRFLSNIIQPHVSSRLNYAGKASAQLNLNQFGLQVGYERIQPGFRSLGTSRIRDDQQKINIGPSFQFLDNRITLQSNIMLGRDNLLNSRLQTRRNTGIATNLQVQLTDKFMINSSYNLLINDFSTNTSAVTNPQNAALDQKQVSHTLTLQPNLTFQTGQKTHNISLSGSYFNFSNKFKGGSTSSSPDLTTNTYSSSITYSLTFPSGLALNAMGNFLLNSSGPSKNTTMGGNAGASYSFFDRKLTLNLNGGINQNESETSMKGMSAGDIIVKSRQMMLNLTGNYQLTDKDSFSLTVRSRSNNVLEGGSSTYAELEASLNYQHRF
jgi:hypothetical protein